MRLNELKTPFRFYADIADTIMRNRECAGYRYKLITPKDRLLPFLFRFPTPEVTALPLHLRLYNADSGALEITVNDNTAINNLDYYKYGQWDYVIYKGDKSLDIIIPHGFHYAELEMEDGTKYYSDEFWVDCDVKGNTLEGDFSGDFNDDFNILSYSTLTKYTKLVWWHPCDIGNLLYQSGYQNILYIDADMVKIETEIVEEGQENSAKDFVPDFVKVSDRVSFSDYLSEPVINALSAVYMHEHVFITTRWEGYTGKAKRFSCKYGYETPCHGLAEVNYLQETTLARTGCCGNNSVQNVYQCQTQISDLDYQLADNGDGTSAIVIFWNVLLGAGPFRITSPQISGGAWSEIEGTNHPIGNWASGAQLYITVKPRCNASNGRVMFGNELSLVINVP